MKVDIDWMLEYRHDLSLWSQDNIMAHASKDCVIKKGRMFINETGGYARACNILTGETIDIFSELSLV